MKSMKHITIVNEVTSKPLYARVKTIGEMFDMNPSTVWRHMQEMKKAGVYDDIVIEENEKTKYISIAGFEKYMKSRHQRYLY